MNEALTRLLESTQRPGLLGIVGMRRERACTRDLATYFRVLKVKLNIDDLATLVNSSSKEVALHSAAIRVKSSLRSMRPALLSVLSSHKMMAFKEGYKIAQVHEVKGLKKLKESIIPSGGPMDHLGPSGESAADYAATSSAESVVGIDETTLSRIQDAIAQGIEEQLGVGGTARLIRQVVTDMSVDRAEAIATTEMNDAFSQATLAKLNDLGIEYKKAVPVDDPCDDCQENADAGAIPVDDEFPTGDDASPFHTRCRCAIVGARAPEEDS